jgi:hypothetical protein
VYWIEKTGQKGKPVSLKATPLVRYEKSETTIFVSDRRRCRGRQCFKAKVHEPDIRFGFVRKKP